MADLFVRASVYIFIYFSDVFSLAVSTLAVAVPFLAEDCTGMLEFFLFCFFQRLKAFSDGCILFFRESADGRVLR